MLKAVREKRIRTRVNSTYSAEQVAPCAACDKQRLCKRSRLACDDFRYFVHTGVSRAPSTAHRLATHYLYRTLFAGEVLVHE